MSRSIVRIQRGDETRYLVWCSVVDAPVTYGMTEDELAEYERDEWAKEGQRVHAERMARVAAKGTSTHCYASAEHLMAVNRAGPQETGLTVEEIVAAYWDAPAEGEEP